MTPPLDNADLALLGNFQHDFPLVARPFDQLGAQLGLDGHQVLERLRHCQRVGQLSRIGAVWNAGAGGAAALCALAVPPAQLETVAELVNRHPGVNHNYEREHAWNLWYVLTGAEAAAVRATAAQIADASALPALFLPMVRAYRIDLGFDLRGSHAPAATPAESPATAVPVTDADRPLAALAEQGLALVAQPYDNWAATLGRPREAVLQTLRRWQSERTLRRFGVVVRHHDLGFDANAMTVLQAPPGQADALGTALAAQPGVTLAYRRVTDPRWPYDLYFMVHGRSRETVAQLVREALAATGAAALPHQTLFSRRRFKQTGGRYFSSASPRAPHPTPCTA